MLQMFCKQILALFLWCHCYQIVLNPFLHIVAIVGLKSNNIISPFLSLNSNLDSRGSNSVSIIDSIFNQQLQYSGLHYVAGSPITVEANQVALTPGHEIVLKCNIAEYPNAQFAWFRMRQYSSRETQPQERVEEELKQNNDRYIINNNVIILKSPTFLDVGDYYCRVKERSDDMEYQKMISVRAKPYIHEFDLESSTYRSAVIEEGKSLKLPCNVIDDYSPESNIRISWHMSKFDENDMNDVISGEDGIKTEIYNSTSQALIIDRVTKDHRRFYKCQVSNGITDNNKVILIRVKDKYTFLWPTVGIVIELVVLIAVIIIVENRKVEPDKVTYDRKLGRDL